VVRSGQGGAGATLGDVREPPPSGAAALVAAMAAGPVVLDGGLATTLENAGHDLTDALWSARLLRDDPAAVVTAHRAHVRAGAQVVTTASYQASREGLAGAGLDAAAADRLVAGSVALARRALAEEGREGWVAASVGPWGAARADGSEYRGDYARHGMDVGGLRRWHRPRLEVLAAAGPDVLACETLPCLAEVEALVAELEALDVPAWLSLTAVRDTAGALRTRAGEPTSEAFALAAGCPAVVAVGVNCCAPDDVPAALAAVAATGAPAVAYPNSGERWDAAARRWDGDRSPGDLAARAPAWVAAGARLVGGCCRVGPAAVARLAGALGSPRVAEVTGQ
jgi:homocysteine S-methyltransferase